jgi:hypothetical protein
MKSSVFLLPSLLRVAVAAESFPYLSSVAFDDGALGAYPNQTYITAPEAISPRFNVLQSNSRCDDGLYTMISLRGDKVELKGQSPMIFDGKGNLIWMNATYGETFGHGVQTYKGEKYLTFWQGDDSVGGHGEGYYFMVRLGDLCCMDVQNEAKETCCRVVLTKASLILHTKKHIDSLQAAGSQAISTNSALPKREQHS